jgi:tyrosinase
MADDMMTITRRTLMTAAAGIGTALSSRHFGDAAFAQPAARTRYNATSPRGRQMLAKYAKAVDIMKNKIPEGDPRHWNFQWYTHWIPGPQGPWDDALATKRRALERVYAASPPSDPHRALAQAMWDTCQVHGADPSDPNLFQLLFFPPWHRLFVYRFEEIVRAILKAEGDDDFTLPYWNYLGDDVSNLSIPPEFRDPASPLFVADRVAQVNAGQRIDWDNPGELNDDAFAEPVYTRPSGEGGFCGLLNLNPHRTVHTLVGNDTNMAGIPYAAKDPLFWVHHCEIDRLWESWCRLPNVTNPVWPDRSFVFAGANGEAVEHKCLDADRVTLLGYQYDSYYAPQRMPDPRVVSLATTQPAAQLTRAAAPAPVRLTADLIRVALRVSPAVLPQAADRTPERIKAAVFTITPGRQLYLVLGNASLEAPADIRYNVYLELAEGMQPAGPKDPHYVGTFYFFDVEPGTHGPHASHDDHAQIFNITEKVRTLDRQGLLTGTPTVSLRPVGRPNPAARPTLGRINLVES